MEINKVQEKIQEIIDSNCARAASEGSSTISTCDASTYGWDSDIWTHRYDIRDAIENRGFRVSITVSYGVTDIKISTKLNFK